MDRGTLLLVALALLAAASVVLGISGVRIFRTGRPGGSGTTLDRDDRGDDDGGPS